MWVTVADTELEKEGRMLSAWKQGTEQQTQALGPCLLPSGWNNQTQLIYFIKVPEVRIGPKWWPSIQAEKGRTELSPLSRNLYVFLVFLTGSHSHPVCPPKTK